MKIGIITYQRALGYGALLQAFALRSFLQREGNEVEIIDYWPEYHAEEFRLFSFKMFKKYSFLGKGKFILSFLFGLFRILKLRRGYFTFMQESLNLTQKPRFKTKETIKGQYDLVICGSDQIWRKQKTIDFKGFDGVYFGDFPILTKWKISYAASMGIIDLDKNDKNYLKRMLKNFDVISVRENNLMKIVEETGHKAVLVFDPVFLLEKKEWENLISNIIVPHKNKYILFYHHTPSEAAVRFVKKMQKHFGYKVKIIRAIVHPFLIGRCYKQTASPKQFLSLLSKAELVVTTSFHGTAFSVIFEKQFYTLGMGDNSDRARSLLSLLGIENRYLNNIDNVNVKDQINYARVNKSLEIVRNISMTFIYDAVKRNNAIV